jgi:translation initiation factor IF-2
MNGWSSRPGADGWDDEPAWVYEITWEWEPVPGQRYPGDPGRRKAVHTPVYEASRGSSAPSSAPPAGQSSPAAGPGRGPAPADDPQRYVVSPPRDSRDDPSWNRPMPYGGSQDQRRGAAPVYGRGVPVTPGQARVPGSAPVSPDHPSSAPVSPGRSSSVPVSPGRGGASGAARVPQQQDGPRRGPAGPGAAPGAENWAGPQQAPWGRGDGPVSPAPGGRGGFGAGQQGGPGLPARGGAQVPGGPRGPVQQGGPGAPQHAGGPGAPQHAGGPGAPQHSEGRHQGPPSRFGGSTGVRAARWSTGG